MTEASASVDLLLATALNASVVTSFDNFLQSTFLSSALQKIAVTPKLSINQSTERSWVNWVTYLFYSFKYQLWQYKINSGTFD